MKWLRIIALTCLLLFPSKISHKYTKDLLAKHSYKQAQCLSTALYFEGRGESAKGRLAIAAVALNRASKGVTEHSEMDVCSVISTPGQFSWHKHNPHTLPIDVLGNLLYDAHVMIEDYKSGKFLDVTNGASHFAGKHVRNYWTRKFRHTVTIGNHKFYRERK